MRKLGVVLIVFLSLNSCGNKEGKIQPQQVSNEELVMYEFSEMALLMEKMFVENEHLKARIEKGEDLGSFNNEYMKIHSAVLTDPNDRNQTFNAFSEAFVVNQQAIYNSSNTSESKENFNKMVQTCIACHETTCTGPIPRIKKLTIK